MRNGLRVIEQDQGVRPLVRRGREVRQAFLPPSDQGMKITIRLYRNNKLIKRLIADRTKWRKVYRKLASAHSEKYLVRVEYNYKKTGKGEKIMFFNEYEGKSLSEAKKALKAFIDEG